MLYIVSAGKEYTWHLGNKCSLPVSTVTEIQADGDELEWIRSSFTGLPNYSDARVLNWYGDHAKFIANCLDKG